MTVPEMLSALEGMVCLVDTREQDTPRLRRRLKQIGVPCRREKLDAGDYAASFPLPDGSWATAPVVIERKMNLDELAACYCRSRKRFTKEFDRAKAAGHKIYLLVEGGSWEDLYSGNYRSKMNPKSFVNSLLAWLARYDCQILFCEPQTTGRLIHDTLYREGKQFLEGMIDE